MPGERAGEEFELDPGALELAGERHQLGGVAGKALELVDGEDDLLVGAASLMSYASLSAFSSSGRVLTRVEIFSEKIRLQSARASALSWEASSCRAVEQRAYPIRIGLATAVAGAASTGGPGFHGRPGPRSSGARTSSSSRSVGTRMKRGVWYFVAHLPPRVRHGLPAGASQFGQSFCSNSKAA